MEYLDLGRPYVQTKPWTHWPAQISSQWFQPLDLDPFSADEIPWCLWWNPTIFVKTTMVVLWITTLDGQTKSSYMYIYIFCLNPNSEWVLISPHFVRHHLQKKSFPNGISETHFVSSPMRCWSAWAPVHGDRIGFNTSS